MGRITAKEIVAYGLQCDRSGCPKLFHVRNENSKVDGFYVTVGQWSDARTKSGHYKQSRELFFCSKTCLLEAMQWQLSSLYTHAEYLSSG